MEISFKSEKLRKLCTEQRIAVREHGSVRANKIRVRLDDMAAAENLAVMRTLPGHYHELTGDRKGQLAVSLDGPYRLIFEPANEPVPCNADGGLSWVEVTAVRILEIVDYHD